MKVNDYVRTDKGTIFKVENITEIDIDGQWFKSKVKENSVIKDMPRFMYDESDEYIIKSSANIIDLIEVGDFVNGSYIQKIKEIKNNEMTCMLDSDYEFYSHIKNEDIESIVTKEQFESMEYKVGENNESN